VKSGILEEEARELNKRFFTFHQLGRPYILLKWAQSADGKIAGPGKNKMQISNPFTNRLVRSWRAEEPAIMVGTETVLKDNPFLTARIPGGKNPVRLIIDRTLRIPAGMHIFNEDAATIIFNSIKEEKKGNIYYCRLRDEKNLLPEVLEKLVELKIQSVLVEGETNLLNAFLDAGIWDEIRLITATGLVIPDGFAGPMTPDFVMSKTIFQDTDRIDYFSR
jgi:diaminohydroxyphosphoribosylaminopyrimidine deaminase/5-amino-6-(5-phosphoribosylamino)uracil reductase